MGFGSILEHSVEAYKMNLRLISAFSIPFLIAFPLSLLLPNFIAMSGTFLRFGSVKLDLSVIDVMVITATFLVSLAFFSFAIAAINVVVKSQRTLTRLTSHEIGSIESATLGIFIIFFTAFAAIVGFNLLLFENGVSMIWGTLFTLIVSAMVLFAPQAIVLEEIGLSHAIGRSISLIERKLPLFIGFLVVAAALFLLNSWIFLEIGKALWFARFLSLVTQSLLILPFLEVLKVQIYLSKYRLL